MGVPLDSLSEILALIRGSDAAHDATRPMAEQRAAPVAEPATLTDVLIANPEPLSKKQRILGGIADALSFAGAGLQGRSRPQGVLERLMAERQAEADRQTQMNLFNERRRREAEAERTRKNERAQDQVEASNRRIMESARESRKIAEERTREENSRLEAMRNTVADMGVRGTSNMDMAQLRDAMAAIREEEIKALSLQEVKDRNDSLSEGAGLRNMFIMGDEEEKLAPLSERVLAGESADDILDQFFLKSQEIPGLNSKDFNILKADLEARIERLQKAMKPDEGPGSRNFSDAVTDPVFPFGPPIHMSLNPLQVIAEMLGLGSVAPPPTSEDAFDQRPNQEVERRLRHQEQLARRRPR